jgi:Predicted nucleotidyltransferases
MISHDNGKIGAIAMLLNELRNKKEDIYKIVEKNKGSQVKVFGSTVTGSETDQSDIDILIKFRVDATLFDLVEIKLELESLLNKRVDVVSENGLKDNEIGNSIKRSAVLL